MNTSRPTEEEPDFHCDRDTDEQRDQRKQRATGVSRHAGTGHASLVQDEEVMLAGTEERQASNGGDVCPRDQRGGLTQTVVLFNAFLLKLF